MKRMEELLEKFQSSDGRIKIASALGVLGVAVAIAVFGVIPALAGNGLPSTAGVQPLEIEYGGGSGGCAFIESPYTEFHINNPMSTTYTLPGGAGTVTLAVNESDTLFDYDFSDPDIAAYQLTVNGGQKSLKYDNDASSAGPRNSDGAIHAPTKGSSQTNLFKVSHINFCVGPAYGVSGLVYDDANVSGDYEAASDSPEEDIKVSVLQDGTEVYHTFSDAGGNYGFHLPAGTYTVCEEDRDLRSQTEPASAPPDCGGLGDYEAFGYTVTVGPASSGNDFGTATELCGQTLTESGEVFDATIEIFAEGNAEAVCEDKVGTLFTTNGEGGVVLNFPLAGSGTIAAFANIQKTFASPDDFEPLEYTQGPTDLSFEDIPWCGLRAKTGADGGQFIPYLANDMMYPSLILDPGPPVVYVRDPVSNDLSVACLVYVDENAEGLQTNILLIQGDPQFR